MKKIISKLRLFGAIVKYWGYDVIRFTKHLNYNYSNNSLDKMKGVLTMNYHVIEKGLTMPETRLGFGEMQVRTLLGLLNSYESRGFSKTEYEYVYSYKILKEYLEFHNKKNFKLNSSIQDSVQTALNQNNSVEGSRQLYFKKEDYFKHTESSFESFALSRFSVRNYNDKIIPKAIIDNCIKIAIKSPSSCNRQPVKIYAVQNKELKEKILKLQSGNRGFGHLADTIIVVSTNISFFQNYAERHELAINAGLFSMSLMYALHSNKIAACPLNWSVPPERDKSLKKILNIGDNEMVNMLISCGYTPNEFSVACSPRESIANILTLIK